MNQTDYRCTKCKKSLLGINWGILADQWKKYQAYFCWDHRPLKLEEVTKKYKDSEMEEMVYWANRNSLV